MLQKDATFSSLVQLGLLLVAQRKKGVNNFLLMQIMEEALLLDAANIPMPLSESAKNFLEYRLGENLTDTGKPRTAPCPEWLRR